MATLNDIITAARDLAYDRFTTPALYLSPTPSVVGFSPALRINDLSLEIRNAELSSIAPSPDSGHIAISIYQEATGTLPRIYTIKLLGTITGWYSVALPDRSFTLVSFASLNLTASINNFIAASPTSPFALQFLNASYVSTSELRVTVRGNGNKHKLAVFSTYTLDYIDFGMYPTLTNVFAYLNERQYPMSYSASWIGSDPSSSLFPITSSLLTPASPTTLFRKYFFSDARITERFIKRYFYMAIGADTSDIDTLDFDTEIQKFTHQRPDHMATWIAYYMVSDRRVYEMAAELLGQSTFSFSNMQGMVGVSSSGGTVQMNIGDVFSLTDVTNTDDYNEGERPAGVGADNVLGDAKSFWYKLELWLRQQVERLYGDYSLRLDNVIEGNISLDRNINFYAYFDSYPYTISPLAREILSSWESNL